MMLVPLSLLALACWAAMSSARNLTEPMKYCLKQRKVYWRARDSCHTLPDLACGSTTSWLVLDANKIESVDPFEPECKARPCTAALHVYWPPSGSCLKMTANVCPEGNKIRDDMYGEGMCDCKTSPVHLPLNLTDDASECYELYTKGPCTEGQTLHAQHIKGKSHIAVCQADLCAGKQRQRGKRLLWDGKTKQCYPIHSRGPCSVESGTLFQVSPVSYLPDCFVPGDLNLFSSLPKRCQAYPNGTCKSPVVIESENTESENWAQGEHVRRKRARA